MKIRKLTKEPDSRPSIAANDGKIRLAHAVVVQAIRDLHSKSHPLRAIDALDWLCSDGYEWLDYLGIYIQPGELLTLAANKKGRF